MKVKHHLLIVMLVICFASAVAQNDTALYEQHDTIYYEWYHNHLSIGLFQSNRDYELTFNQNYIPDERSTTELKYRANARAITGISLDFDKISFNIGFKTTTGEIDKKGNTTVKNFSIALGRTKIFYNFYFRNYKGFYDSNTGNYDTTYSTDQPYYQNSSLSNKTYKLKVTYFPNWEKFSIKSTVAAGFRQKKSAGSFVIQSGIYHNTIMSDTSFIPHFIRPLYNDYAYINYLRTFALTAGGGGSYNLIFFKRFFLNATVILNIETQWRAYEFYDLDRFEATYIKFAFEGRFALGYSSNRFFISINGNNEFSFLQNSSFEAESKYTNLTLNVSYRFEIKKNVVTSYIKDNKIYRKL